MTARPLIHFTPSWNWMNDPNGLVFLDGRYHLYFQYNPFGNNHANMSWGHASSSDLVRWEEHPVAILCDDAEQIYSGSIVVDDTDSSGLGSPGEVPLVAVYTSLSMVTGIQAQSIAYSTDHGMTWTKYDGNPVLDRGSRDFRDPKVFRYRGEDAEYWVMVTVEAAEHQVLFHRSDDLKSWTFLSAFGPAGAVGGVWECPDLFPLAVDGNPDDTRWVLLVSLNPGGVAGGSGTQYFVGRFDGERFIPDVPAPLAATSADLATLNWVDFGRDCYAGVTFNGLDDERRLLIAWMSNWDYARDYPTGRWRGAMTVARRLTLKTADGRPQLCAEPVLPAGEEVARAEHLDVIDATRRIPLTVPAVVRARVRVPAGVTLRAALTSGAGEDVAVIRYSGDTRIVELDRAFPSAVDDDADGAFPSVSSAVVPGEGELCDVTLVVDCSSVEVFMAGGLRVLTDLIPARVDCLAISADGAVHIEELTVHHLGEDV
jgi:levanase/fructan beta-fructosidase/levanbiose-producing levanase